MFTVVLVCLVNFQEYILTNISQLVKLGHKSIYVITNNNLMQDFNSVSDMIHLISAETLNDPFNFAHKSSLDRKFRNGFWHLASARLFVLHSFMVNYNINNVIHIENDVLIYYNCDETLTDALLDKSQMYIPFDTYDRNIVSIVYIPDGDIFGKILSHYDFNKNDMYNFSEIRKQTNLINTLPIFVSRHGDNEERAFITKGWSNFGGYIFDAAAIGQYVGGIDPRNMRGDTRGFVNETCIIKYNDEGDIFWNMGKPFLRLKGNGIEVPIFNLHIHSKALLLYC